MMNPFAHVLIYPENLSSREHRVFHELEHHHHHDLRFKDHIDVPLHASKGDFNIDFTTTAA
jgi:hypothetical protein